MSLKYSNTTADFLQWDEAMNLIRKLAKDENYKISLLVATPNQSQPKRKPRVKPSGIPSQSLHHTNVSR